MSNLPSIIAQMRRLYLHLLREGPITPGDMSRQIARLEALPDHEAEIDRLHKIMNEKAAEYDVLLMERDEEADRLRAIETAATALLADVRRRYPGETLRCPFMIALDEAVSSGVAVSG